MKVGVAGCGYLGRRHAARLADRTDLTGLVLHDAVPGRAEQVAAELGATACPDYDRLLAECGAVVVAASTEAHAELGLRALAAGRHVLVEKPITRTIEEADALIDAARSADRVLMVGHVERFNAAIRLLSGRLMAPRFIEGHRLAAFQPRSLDIDVVLDLMIHDIDLALHFTRELPFKVEAAGTPVLTGKVDIANARLAFPGGCVANLTASRVSLTRTRKIRFFMPNSYVSLDLAGRAAQVYLLAPALDAAGAEPEPPGAPHAAAMEAAAAPAEAEAMAFLSRITHESVTDDGRDALEAEHSGFLAAVRGEAPNPVPGEDGRAALAVALEIAGRLAARGD